MISGPDLEAVKRTRLFAKLDDDVLQELLRGTAPKTFKKGRMLFQQGEQATAFYVLLEGWVKVFRDLPTGDEAVFGVFTGGETFAEAAMFLGERYPASAEVVSDARLLPIHSSPIRERLLANPEICMSMLASMSVHLHRIVSQVEQLQTRSGPQRMANFLLRLCPVGEGPAMVALPYDKALIAARLGMKPESLSRSMSRLREIGVKVEGNRVTIPDVGRLSDYCENTPMRGRAAGD